MIGAEQTYMVVSLAFAVFAAITAVGATLVLSIGFERMRNGFNRVKEMVDVLNRQTGFFSTAIHNMEQRVDALDARQEVLEAKTVESNERTDSMVRYAENVIMQAKHEIKQDIEASHVTQQIQPTEEEKGDVTSGLDALLAEHKEEPLQDQKTKGDNPDISSIYFGGHGDHIRFV